MDASLCFLKELLIQGGLPLKMKEKHARFGLAVPLAAVLLLPSTGFAATNLPQSDAHLPEKVQESPAAVIGKVW